MIVTFTLTVPPLTPTHISTTLLVASNFTRIVDLTLADGALPAQREQSLYLESHSRPVLK